MEEEDTINLNPSELGTKAYWDTAYETEIKNYLDNGDIGKKFFYTKYQRIIYRNVQNNSSFKNDIKIDVSKISIAIN